MANNKVLGSFSKPLFLCSPSPLQPHYKSRAPKIRSWYRKCTLPHQKHTHIHTHSQRNLSHRKWSCAASCQSRQIIHHLKNAPLFLLHHFLLLLRCPAPLLIYCFHLKPSRERQSTKQKALLPALSQNELHSNSK